MKKLEVPYKPQLDNHHDPYSSCNVTSLAMCLSYWGISSPEHLQLEDFLFELAVEMGVDRFSTKGIKTLAESFGGIKDDFWKEATLGDIRAAIDKGRPCILHGYFTASGHIVVVTGYSGTGFYVHDPYGEPMGLSGYDTNRSGANLHFSKGLIAAACDSWCYGEAKHRYPMKNAEAEKVNSIWLHQIYRQ